MEPIISLPYLKPLHQFILRCQKYRGMPEDIFFLFYKPLLHKSQEVNFQGVNQDTSLF